MIPKAEEYHSNVPAHNEAVEVFENLLFWLKKAGNYETCKHFELAQVKFIQKRFKKLSAQVDAEMEDKVITCLEQSRTGKVKDLK